jgi:hypothetical protein
MKKFVFLALAAAGLTLAAQDNSFTLRYATMKVDGEAKYGTSTTYSTDDYKGMGLRYGRTLTKIWDARLDLEGSWQLRTSGSNLKLNGVVYAPAGSTYTMSTESFGLGASLTWTKVVDFGGSFELRHESTELRIESNTMGTFSVGRGLVRPWATFRVGYAFPLDKVKPFVGLEYGVVLAQKEGGDLGLGGFDLGRKLQPKSELAFTAGLRF